MNYQGCQRKFDVSKFEYKYSSLKKKNEINTKSEIKNENSSQKKLTND